MHRKIEKKRKGEKQQAPDAKKARVNKNGEASSSRIENFDQFPVAFEDESTDIYSLLSFEDESTDLYPEVEDQESLEMKVEEERPTLSRSAELKSVISASIFKQQTKTNGRQTKKIPDMPAIENVNTEYKYVDDDIYRISNLVLDPNQVHILSPAILKSNIGGGNQYASSGVIDIINLFLTYKEQDDVKPIFLPIQINENHWVGLILHVELNKITDVSYYNPMANTSDDTKTIAYLNVIFKKNHLFSDSSVKIMKKSCFQQEDGSSCGPCLIDIVHDELNPQDKWLDENATMKNIRLRHLLLLAHQKDEFGQQFYRKFFINQLYNRDPIRCVTKSRTARVKSQQTSTQTKTTQTRKQSSSK